MHCVIMFVMLVRKHPHKLNQDDRWQTIREIASGQPRSPRDLRPEFSRELERIMMKALASDREERYAMAGEFGAEIRFLKERFRAARDRKS